MATILNKAQKEFLDEFIKSQTLKKELSLVTGSKYAGGKNWLNVEDLNESQWTELVKIGDHPLLWNAANTYLIDKSL